MNKKYMEDYYRQMQRLMKIQYELETGTYKRMSNEERLDNYNEILKKFKLSYKSDLYYYNGTCTTDCKVGNTQKSFNNNMKPIRIKEMTLGTTYRNRYIIFEIITELTMMTSVMFLGKDENNDFVLIAIYNFEKYYKTRDYNKLSYIFQKGKYILVLEPFYKMFGSGEDGIRIEDPNEIVIFDDKDWLIKFIEVENKDESFKLLGDDSNNYDILYKEANKSFSIENYNTALVHFTKLKSLKPNEINFDIKIAECYYNIPYYSKCLNKCDEILKINKINIDNEQNNYYIIAISLKIKSLIKLKKIIEAKNLLEENRCIIDKNKKDFIEIENDIQKKIKNMKGEYDFSEIFKKSKDSFNIDIGEYINEKLEIKCSSDKGICVYTKQKLKKGELLVVSKALAACDTNKKKNKKNQFLEFDNPDEEEYEKTKSLLVYKEKEDLEDDLSYKLTNYPEDYSDFLYLFDGKNKNLNLEQRSKNIKIDLKKIQKVIEYNFLTLYFVNKSISYGLWYFPSLFNHSCIPNCLHFGFGDILIIIAINDIEPNSELNINYFYDDMLYDIRQKYAKEYYQFECNCELCKYEKNKFKENKEKRILDVYLKKININIFPDFPKDEKGIGFNKLLTKKEIEQMVKFIEKNKKIFSCYEKSILYLKCAHCMMMYDMYLSYEYLEKSLKYSENRNYFFEKMSLVMMRMIAILLRSDIRLQYASKKLREFWEKYFPSQNKFIVILMDEYLKGMV